MHSYIFIFSKQILKVTKNIGYLGIDNVEDFIVNMPSIYLCRLQLKSFWDFIVVCNVTLAIF